ncbi:hypothetical protein Taro_007461 [Colocasia esculenta]|uniref:BRCA1-associated 2/ETP1 RRM domain-containing protein n=1 Tax=Colocasia esculenta TaxID=4460 RepID=A0A843U401_COLES|nr:hypothetical protein [Colocasia esculenta]
MTFCLRVHTLDAVRRPVTAAEIVAAAAGGGHLHHHHPVVASSPSSSSSPLTAAAAANPSPSVQVCRGIAHLFRNASPPPTSSYTTSSSSSHDQHHHLPSLPAGRGTLLFLLAVPSRLSPEDFLHFCCWSYSERLSEVWVIRNDAVEERYCMLIQFDEQKAADSFYLELNGWRFPSEEAEVCHILFLSSVEYTESTEVAGSPPAGYTELPTCPVCLEKLPGVPDFRFLQTSGLFVYRLCQWQHQHAQWLPLASIGIAATVVCMCSRLRQLKQLQVLETPAATVAHASNASRTSLAEVLLPNAVLTYFLLAYAAVATGITDVRCSCSW